MVKEITRFLPLAILAGFTVGLLAQFIWKLIYFPESPAIIPYLEMLNIANTGAWAIWKLWNEVFGKEN